MFDYIKYDLNSKRFDLDILQQLDLSKIGKFAPLFWAEHCLECSPPECYQSCSMFQANETGRCKRLYYLEIDRLPDYNLPVFHLCYKKWAKLRCLYNTTYGFDSVSDFIKQNSIHLQCIDVARKFDYVSKKLPLRYNYPLSRIIHHEYILKAKPSTNKSTECKELLLAFASHPNEETKLIIDSYDFDNVLLTRHVWRVRDGLNIWKITTDQLTRNGSPIYALELYPANNIELEITFLFSDLVIFKEDSLVNKTNVKPANKVKCVAWDLDNTIWEGIIGEDGLDGISVKPEVIDVLKQLDQRGVLNTICSKNDEELACKGLTKFGIEEYFLYPQINWNPKSSNLLEISRRLNINIDSFAFVDDSGFERNEVQNALPSVRIFSDRDICNLPSLPEFEVPVTEDSIKRRSFYMAEVHRQELFTSKDDYDYKSFIISCEFIIHVSKCSGKKDVERCHELLMRTNQLNASTNRIPYDEFEGYTKDADKLVIIIKCDDKYGEYGTVGCLILENHRNHILCTDFVVSCRVAKKKVESAVIMYLMTKFNLPLDIVYRPSERNHVLLEEFISIGGTYEEHADIIHFTTETIIDYDWSKVDGL